jgi:hypothetical protein
MSNKEMFYYWVEEREAIRQRKESGLPKPWTDNIVMQQTYFCNVDREQDKVTKFIRDRMGAWVGQENFTANTIMARLVNKPESLSKLGYMTEFDKLHWTDVMSQPGSWGSAYIVSTNGRKQPKHEYIAGLLESAFEQCYGWHGTQPPPTLEHAHRRIQALQGMGSFMAAQVVADLKNTKDHPLRKAADWFSWASHGPGSLRGLEWFHEYPVKPSNFMDALVSARQQCYNDRPGLVNELCNQNLQNCFCEYDKFMRVTTGKGRSKRKYNGY